MFNQGFSLFLTGIDESDFSDLLSECSDTSNFSDFIEDVSSVNFDISNGSPFDINNFKVVHYNINSILAADRIDQLTDIYAEH